MYNKDDIHSLQNNGGSSSGGVEGDEKSIEEAGENLNPIEEQPAIECDNQDMMQVNLDALELVGDATDANNPPISTEPIDEVNEAANQTYTTINAIEVNSDSSSLPAIAEDLPNGNSQDTKISNELDAEMVSEDELPAPAQPKVDDAEDLSDEELPGPKRAELPADTEVVSEEEFPSSNKVKRKIEESQEGSVNDNDTAETPKKRAKAELDSKYSSYI